MKKVISLAAILVSLSIIFIGSIIIYIINDQSDQFFDTISGFLMFFSPIGFIITLVSLIKQSNRAG